MNLINKLRPKNVVAFEENATEVQLVNMTFPAKIDKIYVIFEDNNTKIKYLASEKVFAEDIIIDNVNKQKFIVTNIETTTFAFPVKYEEKKEIKEDSVTCKTATIKKYNPLG